MGNLNPFWKAASVEKMKKSTNKFEEFEYKI